MSSYSARFVHYHRYFSDFFEDIFAVTLCLPFTVALHAWNNLTDLLPDFNWLPRQIDTRAWNIGRLILTVPLFLCKGFTNITLAPLLASLAACRKTVPSPYIFPAGRKFEDLALKRLPRFIFFSFIPPILPLPLGLATLGVLLFASGDLLLLGLSIINIEIVLSTLMAFAPLAQPWLTVVLALPRLAQMGLLTAGIGLWVEGIMDPLHAKLSELLYTITAKIQFFLLKKGIDPKKLFTITNSEEIVSLVSISEIAPENLFVSNTHHAFDIQNLERNLVRGLLNYYFSERKSFDTDDILRLEKHPGVQAGRFPQLKQFIALHKQEYFRSPNRLISEQSLQRLDKLAEAMLVPQDTPDFAEKLATAYNAFETHLNQVSAAEKEALLRLNLLAVNDETYMVRNVLNHVFKGVYQHNWEDQGWCKKGIARLIKETTNRERHQQLRENTPTVFWQRAFPTHWMRFR